MAQKKQEEKLKALAKLEKADLHYRKAQIKFHLILPLVSLKRDLNGRVNSSTEHSNKSSMRTFFKLWKEQMSLREQEKIKKTGDHFTIMLIRRSTNAWREVFQYT
jgi:hypothetical protein